MKIPETHWWWVGSLHQGTRAGLYGRAWWGGRSPPLPAHPPQWQSARKILSAPKDNFDLKIGAPGKKCGGGVGPPQHGQPLFGKSGGGEVGVDPLDGLNDPSPRPQWPYSLKYQTQSMKVIFSLKIQQPGLKSWQDLTPAGGCTRPRKSDFPPGGEGCRCDMGSMQSFSHWPTRWGFTDLCFFF